MSNFSPLLIGEPRAAGHGHESHYFIRLDFSPLLIGEPRAAFKQLVDLASCFRISVPFSSGSRARR